MTTRSQDEFHEALRKELNANLFTNARVMDTQFIAPSVDAEALNKCRLSIYCQQNNANRKMIERNDDYLQQEKLRDMSVYKFGGRADFREIGLDQSVQETYFRTYGHGANDNPICDRPDAPYKCECGMIYRMNWRTLPLECRSCHRLTPMGELTRDGVFKR